MMGQWNQMNPQFMMQPHMFDFQRHRMNEMQQADEQQQQWWENYWKNWGQPDTALIRRMQENRQRYQQRDSMWMQRRQQFGPQFGQPNQFGPGFGGPGFGPGNQQNSQQQYNPFGPQFGPRSNH
jgi:hypothetical protein